MSKELNNGLIVVILAFLGMFLYYNNNYEDSNLTTSNEVKMSDYKLDDKVARIDIQKDSVSYDIYLGDGDSQEVMYLSESSNMFNDDLVDYISFNSFIEPTLKVGDVFKITDLHGTYTYQVVDVKNIDETKFVYDLQIHFIGGEDVYVFANKL